MSRWGQLHVTDLLPVTVTGTLSSADPATAKRVFEFGHSDLARFRDAVLEINWEGRVRLSHPGTWTLDERREAMSEMAASLAKVYCILLVQSLPEPVVSAVLPQLQEVAEHELRMWHVGQRLEGPDITERRVFLPIRK